MRKLSALVVMSGILFVLLSLFSMAQTHELTSRAFQQMEATHVASDIRLKVEKVESERNRLTVEMSLDNEDPNDLAYQTGCNTAPVALLYAVATGNTYKLPIAADSRSKITNACVTTTVVVPAHSTRTLQYAYEIPAGAGSYLLRMNMTYTLYTGNPRKRYVKLSDGHTLDTFHTTYIESDPVEVQLRDEAQRSPGPSAPDYPQGSHTGPFHPKVLIIDYNTLPDHSNDGSTELTSRLTQALSFASGYHGSTHASADFTIYQIYRENNPPPLRPGAVHGIQRGDYQAVFNRYNICGLAATQGVNFVWIWASGAEDPPNIYYAADFYEWVMTGPTLNIAFDGNVPTCGSTVVTFAFNYSRGVSSALHSFGHFAEQVLQYGFGPADYSDPNGTSVYDLFDGQIARYLNYTGPLNTTTAKCGNVHFAPNSTVEYHWDLPTVVQSDCATYNPGNPSAQQYVPINANTWMALPCDSGMRNNCIEQTYLQWWMRNMPGYDNLARDQFHNPMPNWWQYLLALDTVGSITPPQPPTATPTATVTPRPTVTPVGCGVPYTDIAGNPFETYIRHLYCRGILTAGSDVFSGARFLPYSDADRGTLARWVVRARGWSFNLTGAPHFTDVSPSDPLYPYIETAYNHGVLSGYTDHTFRPTASVTRGQMSKMIVNAMGWPIDTSPGRVFRDVDQANPFWGQIETIYAHGLVSGYTCGNGCLEFRWGNSNTRGQLSKVLDNSLLNVPPEAPTNLQAVAVDPTRVRLTWRDNSNSETGFHIYDGDVHVGDAGANTTQYIVGGVVPNTYHCYHLFAYNAYGDSAWTDWACVTTPPPGVPPNPPTNPHVTALDSTHVQLTWQDNSNNETGFYIYDGDIHVGDAAANATQYLISGVTPNTYHCYQLAAFNAYGASAWTDWVCTTTPAPGVAPAAPTDLLAVATDATHVRLTWRDNSNNETGFHIYDADIYLGDAAANATQYLVGGVAPNTYHCYHLYAFNAYGDSAWTDWACVTTPPGKPLKP